ncbi:MAG TPA: SbcC/MukB-like Walker B domain-containing protein [Streptosporangiaceae bacterium]|nr:SbcC/MukB-like Walker B domain-containing protein [Streptosporangiaceae bacterium]
MNTDRFRPTRAGVINVWDYVDEEFVFADGRLALRGHNGSGKTKALEVLFPFVLDGVADSRRLDPFSGENRTMKSNLLYRGQEAEYGYVWMEFARPDPAQTVTLVIGIRAHRNRDGVQTSFFVTSKRLGIDFGLLSADSRPLTERQLRAVLEPGAWHKTATEYRDAVDAWLFGLGRGRYAQLLDLLLALRRPLLAKDLDPVKVSDTLTAGLSPVDDDLVQQAARDFENLAAVQKLFDDLCAADAAVGEFLAQYTAYLRAHVRFQLDRVQARMDAAAGQAGRIAAAAAAHSRAIAAEQQAVAGRDAKGSEGERLQGRLAGLKNSEEYRAQGRLEDKRREVLTGQREVADQRNRLRRDHRQIEDLLDAAARLSRRATEARTAEHRFIADLADAAQRAGISDDGFGPIDTGDELLVTARARAVARLDDVSEVRKLLEAIRDAKAKRAFAEEDAARKAAAQQREEEACQAAGGDLARVRQAAADELAAWATRWSAPVVPAAPVLPASSGLADEAPAAGSRSGEAMPAHVVDVSDVQALASTLEQVEEPGAASLAEVFASLTAQRQDATITMRTNLETELREASRKLADLRAGRDAIAAERDDAPPPTDLRTAPRDGRPGAPLWQLVRFADSMDVAQAAAVEGALYGAGLLTAWVHPDPARTHEALAAAEADGYLLATVPARNPTLADILLPEDQEHVSGEVITAVLRSVALTDDIAASTPASQRAAPPSGLTSEERGGKTAVTSAPAASRTSTVISTKAQFSYGVHAGARPKPAPEYIGATNRANRRRARLAETDELIQQATAQQQRLTGRLEQARALLADFRLAQRELPVTAPLAKAAEAVSRHAALLARAREELADASKTLDAAVADVDAKGRLLRQAAAQRRMPTAVDQVDAVARAVAEFEGAATQLDAERVKLAQAEEDLAEQTETIERLRVEYDGTERALAGRERAQLALEEEFGTLHRTLGADVAKLLEQIRETENLIKAAKEAYDELDTLAQGESRNAARAEENLRNGREALAEALAQLYEQAAEFGPYARIELRPLIGVSGAGPWPDAARWADTGLACEEITEELTRPVVAAEPEPAAVVRRVLPANVAEVLDAFHAATRGGRQVTEGALKNTQDRMSTALKDFTDALAACDEDYRVDWIPGGVVTVHVLDDEGRKPVAEFAARIAERKADQSVLLEDRERKVLEDELLAGLADQIHGRVIAARDLVRDMDADTRSKPMSSGIAVGIRWAQSDRITDKQRAASRLLERAAPGPERLAELRGLLREMIREYRASHPRATYREALGSVLDYRAWHVFELVLLQPGEPEVRLTRARHSAMSGGEKSASIHLPLFAAANALYSSAKDHCPRLVALDEAFVGIDERYKPDLFGLAVKFGLDLFMTGHDLWVTCATVPMIAHYDMYHDKASHTVSSLLMLWDGMQLVDATAGNADNEALVTRVLGFRPTRHTPLGIEATLYTAAVDGVAEDDDGDDEDGEDEVTAGAVGYPGGASRG